jgi:hypothetical protein
VIWCSTRCWSFAFCSVASPEGTRACCWRECGPTSCSVCIDAQYAAGPREALPLKNTLTAADAQWVETGFALKVSAFPTSDGSEPSDQALPQTTAAADSATAADVDPAAEPLGSTGSAEGHEAGRIDKSVLTLSTPHRYRNKEHLRFVAQQPCLLCGRKPTDAHHIRFVQPRALGRKASDEFAVPLCRAHHRAVHRTGDEKAWWQQAGINPIKIARKLWKLTRAHEPRIASAAPTQDAAAERPAASGGQGPATPATA